jgi:serine/threonine-protein kinase
VKIVDFGVAKMAGHDVTATGVAKGTVAYMSPEQVLGEAVDCRTDLWSLGVVLHEMLTGERPFEGDNVAALVHSIRSKEPQSPAQHVGQVPAALEHAVARMLEKEPRTRYGGADELLADLERLVGDVALTRASPMAPVDRFAGGAQSQEALNVQEQLAARRNAVAVLPFENLSPDPQNEYFSDGLTEEIIASLTRIPSLRVVPRTSVMLYKGAAKNVKQIAGELDVGTIVEGSVRKAGNRVRIVAQALDAGGDKYLWSETYDRKLEDIFEIQSDVAAGVCQAVQAELSVEQRAVLSELGTSDIDAYDQYLKGRYLWNQRTEQSLNRSLECFSQAVVQDPRFALAHAGLADSYATLGVYGASLPDEVMVAAKSAAAAALRINPNLARALTTQACVRAVYDWDWEGAESDFLYALQHDPEYATAHQWYAVNLLVPLRRFEEAQEELERASRLEPLSSAIAASKGVLAYFSRDFDHAIEEYEATLNLHPHFGLAYYFIGQCETEQGRLEEGLKALRKAAELTSESSETMAALGHCLAVSGKRAEAIEVLHLLEDRSKSGYVSPVLPAQILTGLGEHESAMDRLERAVELRASDLIWLRVRPVFDPLHSHPAFDELVSRIGLR